MIGRLLRQKIKFLNELLAKPFILLKIEPNIVSFLGVILSLIAFYFIIQKAWLLAIVFAILAMSMDLIDGTIARKLKKETNFGNYFETMMDKIIEVILFAGFAFYYPIATVLALGFSLVESYAKPRVALVIITDNRDWPSIAEHSERMLMLLLAMVFSYFNVIIAGYNVAEIILWLIAITTIIGTIQRINYAKKLIKEAEQKNTILPYLKEKKYHEETT